MLKISSYRILRRLIFGQQFAKIELFVKKNSCFCMTNVSCYGFLGLTFLDGSEVSNGSALKFDIEPI